MFGDEKDIQQNLKDIDKDSIKDTKNMPAPYEAKGLHSGSVAIPYSKLSKLITALYIVTDIMDKEEPLRSKLRTFGIEILSDINSISDENLNQKIQTILSFLDIALSINLVSEMNCNILRKEFVELGQSFQSSKKAPNQINSMWLEEFLLQPTQTSNQSNLGTGQVIKKQKNFNENNSSASNMSKKQRRDDVLEVIKQNGGNATITDIKNKASALPTGPAGEVNSLATCSEKTLQRELISMVKDGVLRKEGSKRWSKYFLP